MKSHDYRYTLKQYRVPLDGAADEVTRLLEASGRRRGGL
jgi:hypothetical protein